MQQRAHEPRANCWPVGVYPLHFVPALLSLPLRRRHSPSLTSPLCLFRLPYLVLPPQDLCMSGLFKLYAILGSEEAAGVMAGAGTGLMLIYGGACRCFLPLCWVAVVTASKRCKYRHWAACGS